MEDLLWRILALILLWSDSDLMMMDSGVDSETDSSVEDSVEDSGVDSGLGLMKSQKVTISLCVFNTFCKN